MPNRAIELHDAEVAVLWYEGNSEAVLIFSTLYIHQSEGVPGADSGIIWWQRAELEIKMPSDNAEELRDYPYQIYDGDIFIDGVMHINVVPLPLKAKNSFRIILKGIDDESNLRQIDIKGTQAKLTLLGEIHGSKEFKALKDHEK